MAIIDVCQTVLLAAGAVLVLAGGAAASLPEVEYGTGSWPESGRGNHRAVVRVSQKADAVVASIPWRRRDADPDKKAIIVYDSTTGERVANVLPLRIDRYSGDIAFQPKTVPGNYEIYYMPYDLKTWSPGAAAEYLPPQSTAEPEWVSRNSLTSDVWKSLPKADIIRIEARTDFHRMDPMEVVATPNEVQSLIDVNPGRSYLIFPEDRKNPVRMQDDLPFKWIKAGPSTQFSGHAQPNEYYTFQLAAFAFGKRIEDAKVEFSDLKNQSGAVIPAAAFNCFNLGGNDWIGQPFTKKFVVGKGKVGTLWIGLQVPENASGDYTGSVTITPAGEESTVVKLVLNVSGLLLKDHGDSETWRHSRLRWLNSKLGLDDSVLPPFTPLRVRENRVDLLGRTVTFASTGLPKSIVSNGREILAQPISLAVKTAAGELTWKPQDTQVTSNTQARLERKSTSLSEGLSLTTWSKTEFDGCVMVTARLEATQDIALDDISLKLPVRNDVAKYMMGFGCRGGYRPERWDWKWNVNTYDNMLWLGDYNAGVQVKLTGPHDWMNLADYAKYGVSDSWGNGGKGGATVSETGDTVMLQAYSGGRTLKAGESLEFRFRLLVTPFKPIDPNHWNWRYGGLENGGNIVHVHHASPTNPYINYPFIKAKEFADLVKQVKSTPDPASAGRIDYPTAGNIRLNRGSLHIKAKIDFDLAASKNQELFYVRFGSSASTCAGFVSDMFGFYWNHDVKGMRVFVRKGAGENYPLILDAPQPDWKKGEEHLLTLSWGDKVEIFIDGKRAAVREGYQGIMNAPLEMGLIELCGGFGISGIKICDRPYTEGSPITMSADDSALLCDTFASVKNNVSHPEKCASGTMGKLSGAVNKHKNPDSTEITFSSKPGDFGVNIYYTIRELSNHCTELWALRSLGEVFEGAEAMIYTDKGATISQRGGGNAWLQEHLISGYSPAWEATLSDTDVDAAIATQFSSRWNNYYVEGMDWLMKNTGLDGLYLDGIGYDRETIRRIAKVMRANNPNYRINFHSGNSYDYINLKQSPMSIYMEHLPYVSNLWFGEMYDYNRSPDYWLVEVSGIPFGLTGEMFEYQNGGNPYRGMIYGMTGRFHPSCVSMWKFWDEFGIQDAKMIGYWDSNCPVKTDNPDVLATVYKKKDRILIALADWSNCVRENRDNTKHSDASQIFVHLRIEWKSLGIDADKAVLNAPVINNFQADASFSPKDAISIEPGKGMLLILESKLR